MRGLQGPTFKRVKYEFSFVLTFGRLAHILSASKIRKYFKNRDLKAGMGIEPVTL